MKAVLSNGETREISISSRTMGLQFDSLVLKSSDLIKLLEMNDGQLRELLSVLTTRFGPENEGSAKIAEGLDNPEMEDEEW